MGRNNSDKLAAQFQVAVLPELGEQFLEDLIEAMTVVVAREARHPEQKSITTTPSNTESFNRALYIPLRRSAYLD
jgi:hypothetical protein